MELFTDHKPLVAFFNKMEEAPNNRMMTMLLTTSKYTQKMDYLPGIKKTSEQALALGILMRLSGINQAKMIKKDFMNSFALINPYQPLI